VPDLDMIVFVTKGQVSMIYIIDVTSSNRDIKYSRPTMTQ